MKNQRNLLDSAARIFRNQLPGSRFQALLDNSTPGVAPSILDHYSERGLPYTLRLSRSAESTAPQLGDMPPAPPTMRGRLGAILVRVVRRALFWYTNQIRSFHG